MFITVPLAPQIKRLMEGWSKVPACVNLCALMSYMRSTCVVYSYYMFVPVDKYTWSALQERFCPLTRSGMCDIYDGEGYRQHSSVLSRPTNISLLLNTDGVAIIIQIFKSVHMTCVGSSKTNYHPL